MEDDKFYKPKKEKNHSGRVRFCLANFKGIFINVFRVVCRNFNVSGPTSDQHFLDGFSRGRSSKSLWQLCLFITPIHIVFDTVRQLGYCDMTPESWKCAVRETP